MSGLITDEWDGDPEAEAAPVEDAQSAPEEQEEPAVAQSDPEPPSEPTEPVEDVPAVKPPPPPALYKGKVRDFAAVRTVEAAQALADKLLADGKLLGFDVETGYSGPDFPKRSLDVSHPDQFVVGFSITNDPSWARYLPLRHDTEENLDPGTIWEIFRPVLEGLEMVAHHKKFEDKNLLMLAEKADADAPIYTQTGHDTMLEAYVLSRWQESGLKPLTKQVLGVHQAEITSLFGEALTVKQEKCLRFNTLPLSPEVISYACDDAALCLELHEVLSQMLSTEPPKRQFIYNSVERKISELMAQVENYGIGVNWDGIAAAEAEYLPFRENIQISVKEGLWQMLPAASDDSLSEEAKEEIRASVLKANLGSSPQMSKLLYEDIGLKVTRRTDKGAPSTDAIALERLSKKHMPVKQMLQSREVDNLGRRMGKWLVDYRGASDNRVHANFNQVRVITGRFSASDPAVQQLPKEWFWSARPDLDDAVVRAECTHGKDYWAGNFRNFIVADEGNYLLTYDYSQVELRVLAGESQEKRLLEAFAKGEDVHTLTAAMMLGKEPADVDKKTERPLGKTMNFALLYQMGPDSLADRLAISMEKALSLYSNYFKQFSSISTWIEKAQRDGKTKGYAETYFGRKATVWELQSSNRTRYSAGERATVNYPIQGGAADYMKIAMIRAWEALKKAGLWGNGVMLTMNQHDSLTFEVSNKIDPATLRELLQGAVVFPIKGFPVIKADWELGQRWGDSDPWSDEPVIWDGQRWKVDVGNVVAGEVVPAPEPQPAVEEDEPAEEEYEAAAEAVVAAMSRPLTAVPDLDEPEVEEVLVVTMPKMPFAENLQKFMALLTENPGKRIVELSLPQGHIRLDKSTSLGLDDAGTISLVLGGATVSVPEASVDLDAISVDLSL